jgi:hypothetical protein
MNATNDNIMNQTRSILTCIVLLLSIASLSGQKQVLSLQIIEADKQIDSLFRDNFRRLESYKQVFIIKEPGFSMTEFSEPDNKEVYKFVDLLILLSGIPSDSIICQKGWKHEYQSWNDKKITEWELWYNKNAKNLNYQVVLDRKTAIDNRWGKK